MACVGYDKDYIRGSESRQQLCVLLHLVSMQWNCIRSCTDPRVCHLVVVVCHSPDKAREVMWVLYCHKHKLQYRTPMPPPSLPHCSTCFCFGCMWCLLHKQPGRPAHCHIHLETEADNSTDSSVDLSPSAFAIPSNYYGVLVCLA